jgi:hypothetical protein
MGSWDRMQRRQLAPLPHRLVRLNRELMKERTRSFDYLNAVEARYGLRFRICVMRNEDGLYFATAQFAGHAYRVESPSPSGAFEILTLVSRRAINLLPATERLRIIREDGRSAALCAAGPCPV